MRPPFALGRGFDAAHDDLRGQAPSVVLSNDLWQGRFGGDPEIVGKTIEMNRRTVKVVGVAAADSAARRAPWLLIFGGRCRWSIKYPY